MATKLSNYPGGFPNGVSIRGMTAFESFAGNVFWLSSSRGADTGKGTRDRPFATLDYAIGRCTANNGDVIMVMPNHAETITGVGGITVDVDGISIIGMGSFNQRPRFLMDGGTTVSAVISAADATLRNLVFASGHASVATLFGITGVGAHIDFCEATDNTTFDAYVDCRG